MQEIVKIKFDHYGQGKQRVIDGYKYHVKKNCRYRIC